MTSSKTSGDPIPLQFLPRLQALPLVQYAIYVASDTYLASKARYQKINFLFEVAEGTILRVSTATCYYANALASLVGGLEAVDGLACQGLDKLESVLPIIKKSAKEIKREFVLRLLRLIEDDEELEKIKAVLNDAQEANTQESCEYNCADGSTTNPTLDEGSFSTAGEDIKASGKHLAIPEGPRITRGLSLDSVYRTPLALEESKSRNIAHALISLSDSRENAQKIPWWRKVFQKRHSISPTNVKHPNLHNQEVLNNENIQKIKSIQLAQTESDKGDYTDLGKEKILLERKTDDLAAKSPVNSEPQIENGSLEKSYSGIQTDDVMEPRYIHENDKQMKYSFENCEEETREHIWSTSTPQIRRKRDAEQQPTEQIFDNSYGDCKIHEDMRTETETAAIN